MADISQVTLPSGNTYNIKDAQSRSDLLTLLGSHILIALGAAAWMSQDSSVTAGGTGVVAGGAIKSYVDSAIAAISKFQAIVCPAVASQIPQGAVYVDGTTSIVGTMAASEDTSMKIYFVLSNPTGGDKKYKEWMTIQETSGEITSYRWEEIGDTQIDLSDYVKKTTKIAGVDLENDITVEELSTALNLKALSHKDSVSGSYVKPTGSGSVSVADSWDFSGDKSNIVVPGQTVNVPITNTTKNIGVTDVVIDSAAENFVDNVSSSIYDLNDGMITSQSDVVVTKQEISGVSGSVTASNTTVKNGTAADWKANVTNETLIFSWEANKPTEVTTTSVSVPVATTPIEVVTNASGSFVNSVSFRGNEEGNAYVVESVGFTTGSAITSVSVKTQPTLSEKTGGIQVVSSVSSSSATIGQQTIEYTPSGTVSSAGASITPVTVETTTDTVTSS